MKKPDWDKRLIKDEGVTREELDIINQENNLVVKGNELIQKSTFNFSELELKCLNYTISKLRPEKTYTENDYIEYNIKDLIKVLKISDGSKNYKILKDTLKNISDQSKWIRVEKMTGVYETAFRFFMKCEIDKNRVRIKFMQEMLDYLQNLKNKFTAMLLVYTLNLKSKYSIRLYELSKSYEKNILKSENGIPIYGYKLYIENIRLKWCISEKLRYCDLKKSIARSIDEINSLTDIKVSILSEHKNNRKVDYIELKVENNEYSADSIRITEKLIEQRKQYLSKDRKEKVECIA